MLAFLYSCLVMTSCALPSADDGLLAQLPCEDSGLTHRAKPSSVAVQLPPEDSGLTHSAKPKRRCAVKSASNLVLPCDDDADLVVQLPTDSKANAVSLPDSAVTLPDQCCSHDCMRKLHPSIASTCCERKRQMSKLTLQEANTYLVHLVSTWDFNVWGWFG